MKLNCAYCDTDGLCLKYSTYNYDVPCLGNPNCDGFAEDFGADTNVGCKTNADHIRSMTDEELATLLEEVGYDSMEHRSAYWLNWLKQPYKEDA